MAAAPTFRLDALEIHLWSVKLEDFISHNRELARVLSFEELVDAQKIASDLARGSFITCRGLLRYVLSCYVDAAPKELPIEWMEGRHAVLELAGSTIRFDYSSTTGEALYVVSADRPLGVSLAELKTVDEASLASLDSPFTLAANEQEALLGLSEEARAEKFFRIFTRREALAKAQWGKLAMSTAAGEGARVASSPMLRIPPEPGRHTVNGWCVEDLKVVDGHASAVAAQNDDWRLRCIFVKLDSAEKGWKA